MEFIHYHGGYIEMTAGTISVSSTNGEAKGIHIVNSGEVKVTGGTIISSTQFDNSYGIYNNSGKITIGIKGDGVVSQEEPYIKGERRGTSGDHKGYGVRNTTGKLYYYDGRGRSSTRRCGRRRWYKRGSHRDGRNFPPPVGYSAFPGRLPDRGRVCP